MSKRRQQREAQIREAAIREAADALQEQMWDKAVAWTMEQTRKTPATTKGWKTLSTAPPERTGVPVAMLHPENTRVAVAGSTSKEGYFQSTAASKWSTADAVPSKVRKLQCPIVIERHGIHWHSHRAKQCKEVLSVYRQNPLLLIASLRARIQTRQRMHDSRIFI